MEKKTATPVWIYIHPYRGSSSNSFPVVFPNHFARHLMVKHGLLSPHSKLLPRPEDGESRPESILSMGM